MSSPPAAGRALTGPVVNLKWRTGSPARSLSTAPGLKGQDHAVQPPRIDSLNGDYAAITHLRIQLTPGSFRRMLILMVPRGGEVGALVDGHAYRSEAGGALVLFNQVPDHPTTFTYDFSLPANTYAPVHFVFVPLRS